MNQAQEFSLNVYDRPETGKNASYRMRATKRIPAIVYGPEMKTPLPVSLDPKELRLVFRSAGRTGLVTLAPQESAPSELKGVKVLFKEIQMHPFKNELTHVDLHKLDLNRKVRVVVPLKFIGKAKGVAEGGIVSTLSREVEIKAPPTDIPNHIDVDISELNVNDSIKIEELANSYKGGKYEFIYESNYSLVAVVPPDEVEETAEEKAKAAIAAGGAAAAPKAGESAEAAKKGDK